MIEADVCEQLAQSPYLTAERPEVEPTTYWLQVRCPNHYATKPRAQQRKKRKKPKNIYTF